ncbi:MAG TPA: outer membrane protein assembly factor BamA, partial [Thermoanaerobaculia bacterium]
DGGGCASEGATAPFTHEDLARRMRTETGDAFAEGTARRDAERIESFLVEKGYRRAAVRYLDPQYDAASDTVRLRYAVETGPPVRVEVGGVRRRSIRRLLPMRGDEPYTADAIERARDDIRRHLQLRGHYFASVEVVEGMVGDEYVVRFEIDPGPRYDLARVEFAGNAILEDDQLRQAVTTAPDGGFRTFLRNLFRRPGGVNQETLDDDVESLETLYRVEGFANATIGRPEVVAISADELQVTFPIAEGPRTLVTDVRVEGVERFEPERLPRLALQKGEPLNPVVVLGDIIALQNFYGDRGHVEVQVAPRYEYNADRTGAIVTYAITEGPAAEVKEAVVRGNTYTDTEVIERQAKVEPGEPFSYTTLLAAQRELYRLGIFQRVDVHADDSASTPGNRTVVIDVEEGKALTIGGSVGYSEERGAGGSFSLSHRNLFGTARFLGLEARKFEREERYLLNYREPFIGRWDVPVQVTVFTSEEERSGRLFERWGTFVEASRIVGETVRWSTRYEYRNVDCTELLPPDAGDFVPCGDPASPIEEREVQISSITPNVFWDDRDDPLNPFRGMFASASLEYAFPLFAAETKFLKGFAQGAWYRPLSQRSTLAISARVGLTEKLATTGPGSIVPFPERFTAGGESSHRAFDHDELGILCIDSDPDCQPTLIRTDKGRIYPLGGNALLLANAEYRFPIFGSLQGAAFTDIGNVWREIDAIDFSEMRYGAGVGLRYLTPVGPIRLDIGWKLDRKPWEEPYATSLTIGFAY